MDRVPLLRGRDPAERWITVTLRERVESTISELQDLAHARLSHRTDVDAARADSFLMTIQRLKVILAETPVEVLAERTCENCNGLGRIGGIYSHACEDCGGSGKLNV